MWVGQVKEQQNMPVPRYHHLSEKHTNVPTTPTELHTEAVLSIHQL